MKKILTLFGLPLLVIGCATTSSVMVPRENIEIIRNLNSFSVSTFKCADELVAQAVQGMIIEELLGIDVSIVSEADADAVIRGTITISSDYVQSGGAFAGADTYSASAGGYSLGTAGIYVSGITAQIFKNDIIVGSTTVTQVRSDMWIPDPPQVMARKIGKNIRQILSK